MVIASNVDSLRSIDRVNSSSVFSGKKAVKKLN